MLTVNVSGLTNSHLHGIGGRMATWEQYVSADEAFWRWVARGLPTTKHWPRDLKKLDAVLKHCFPPEAATNLPSFKDMFVPVEAKSKKKHAYPPGAKIEKRNFVSEDPPDVRLTALASAAGKEGGGSVSGKRLPGLRGNITPKPPTKKKRGTRIVKVKKDSVSSTSPSNDDLALTEVYARSAATNQEAFSQSAALQADHFSMFRNIYTDSQTMWKGAFDGQLQAIQQFGEQAALRDNRAHASMQALSLQHHEAMMQVHAQAATDRAEAARDRAVKIFILLLILTNYISTVVCTRYHRTLQHPWDAGWEPIRHGVHLPRLSGFNGELPFQHPGSTDRRIYGDACCAGFHEVAGGRDGLRRRPHDVLPWWWSEQPPRAA